MSIPFSVLQDYLDLISPEALPQIPQPPAPAPTAPQLPPAPDPHSIEWPIFPPDRISANGRRYYEPQTRLEFMRIYTTLPHGYRQPFLKANNIGHCTVRTWLAAISTFSRLPHAFDDAHRFGIERTTPVDDVTTLTADDKRDLVIGYLAQPHGQGQQFLTFYQLRKHTIMAWCAAMTDGDLDADISPRQIGLMTTRTVVEIVRLRHMIAQQLERATIMENEYLKEIAALKKELAHYKQKDHQNQMVIDILGKAIGTRPNPGEGLDEEDAT
ncbi:hypothetical protein H2J98_05185 [Corynebacterium glutamicum]|uniref:Uncharacterized protein n=3 Tax=Corynebacterium glutamicum TaxID=1718 RepID=Q8NQB8_CORGL|nr:hypothetical protein [Corynebacterium glutamicum]ARV64342.1 hypothetical protein B7P23_05275 [Corynebacterium glutamicum]AUI01035.1 hypothetical protein CYL77_07715 [Corynebacterium glutamicum]AUI04680.1 hypothetical protein C0I99_11410 [Corynebacterium glutamicum]MBA4569956.1 hypothetical protein [Corynebacterium glutamicum]MBA4575828.1 hypothetical protein [Corynebacterium glutamicum]